MHPQRLADGRDAPPDGAVAQDNRRLARKSVGGIRAIVPTPISLAQLVIQGSQMFAGCQQERQRHLRRGDIVEVEIVEGDVRVLAEQFLGLHGHAGKGHDDGPQVGAGSQVFRLHRARNQNVTVKRLRLGTCREFDSGWRQLPQIVEGVRSWWIGKVDSDCHQWFDIW